MNNYQELISYLQTTTTRNETEVKNTIHNFIQALAFILSSKNVLEIPNLGTFTANFVEGRQIINRVPMYVTTQSTYAFDIPSEVRIVFSPSQELIDQIIKGKNNNTQSSN